MNLGALNKLAMPVPAPAEQAAIATALSAVDALLAAPYGTRLAHRIGGKALKQVFAAFMVMMGIAILASG